MMPTTNRLDGYKITKELKQKGFDVSKSPLLPIQVATSDSQYYLHIGKPNFSEDEDAVAEDQYALELLQHLLTGDASTPPLLLGHERYLVRRYEELRLAQLEEVKKVFGDKPAWKQILQDRREQLVSQFKSAITI